MSTFALHRLRDLGAKCPVLGRPAITVSSVGEPVEDNQLCDKTGA